MLTCREQLEAVHKRKRRSGAADLQHADGVAGPQLHLPCLLADFCFSVNAKQSKDGVLPD